MVLAPFNPHALNIFFYQTTAVFIFEAGVLTLFKKYPNEGCQGYYQADCHKHIFLHFISI